MTYQKEEKMEEGLKLRTLSTCLSPLLMPLSSLESLANVVSVPKTWLLCLVSIHYLLLSNYWECEGARPGFVFIVTWFMQGHIH